MIDQCPVGIKGLVADLCSLRRTSPFPAFDLANVSVINAGNLGELAERQPASDAQPPEHLPEVFHGTSERSVDAVWDTRGAHCSLLVTADPHRQHYSGRGATNTPIRIASAP